MSQVKRCVYGSCNYFENTSEDSDGSVYLVPFPKPVTKRTRLKVKRWIESCGEEKSEMLQVNIEQKRRRLFVCSSHFVGKNGPTKFNPDPVPYDSSNEDILKVQLFKRRKVCAVQECESVSTHDELVTFHTLPKHHVQLELWKEAIQFDEETLAKKLIFVCSKHFISGMKSDFPSHPDFVPSIFPSSTSQEIKALRNKLREFECGQTKDILEKSCASLRKHWYECGFNTKDLSEGVRRVKAQKRHLAHQENVEYEKKKARLEEEKAKLEQEEEKERQKRKEMEESLEYMKQESGSDTVDEDFVIETDRAEEDEIDLSSVKEEPVSDSESLPPANLQDKKTDQGSLEGGRLLSEENIKQEPSDDDYEQSLTRRNSSDKARDDSCDEMLTVHFGKDESTDTEIETEPIYQGESDRQSAVIKQTETGQQVVQLQVGQYKSVQKAFANQNFPLDSKNDPQTQAQILDSLTGQKPILSSQQTRNDTTTGLPKVNYSNQGQNAIAGQNSLNQLQFLPNNFLFPVGQTGNQQILIPNNFVNVLGQPLIPVPIVGFQGGKHNIDGAQQLNIPQIGGQYPLVNQIPMCISPASVSKPPEGITSSVPKPFPSIAVPSSGAPAVTSTVCPSSTPSSSNMKTVVALDPNTYQSPLTNSTTFVVPQENILTLSFDDLNKAAVNSEKPKDLKTIYTEGETVDNVQAERHETDDSFTTEMLSQFNRQASTSSEEMHVSSDEDSRDSVHSEGYQPGSSSESSDLSQDEFEESMTKGSQKGHDSSPDIELLNIPQQGQTSKKCNKSTSLLLHEKLSGSKKHLPGTPKPKEKVSKDCQTERSLSKEACLEAKLKEIGVQATSEQFKYLLKQPLLANGQCQAFKMARKVVVDCTVQVDMDKMILPDLAYQCKRLSKDVSDYKARYHALTYDFLQSASTKSKVNCHTGCYTLRTLKELFEYVSICLDSPPLEDLSQFQEFVLTLMKLRLGLHNYDLAFRFEIPPSLVPQILTKWVSVMANTLCQLLDWPLEEPERTEHRNQRWRILKLRYDLLMAYDGIESMKDKWLLEQDLDTIIMICDVLNSFQVKEGTAKMVKKDEKIETKPVKYFVEECVMEDITDDDCVVTSELNKPDEGNNSDATESGDEGDKSSSNTRDIDIITGEKSTDTKMLKEKVQEDGEGLILVKRESKESETPRMKEGKGPEDPVFQEMVDARQEEDMDLEDVFKDGNNKASEIIKEGKRLMNKSQERKSSKETELGKRGEASPSTEMVINPTNVIDITDVPHTELSEKSGSKISSENNEKGTEGTGSTTARCEVSQKETKSKSSKKQRVYQVIHVDDGNGLMIGPPALEVEVVETEHVPETDKPAAPTYGRFIPSEILNCFE